MAILRQQSPRGDSLISFVLNRLYAQETLNFDFVFRADLPEAMLLKRGTKRSHDYDACSVLVAKQ
jgi:hypothetical protein